MKSTALAKLLLCFLISASIWLVRNLTLDYPETESVPVLVRSHIEGRAETASSEVTVTARCVTSGFNHIGLSWRRKAVKLDVDPSDFQKIEGDAYKLADAKLYKYASRIFGESVNIESFATDGVVVKFEPVDYRKVPVVPITAVSYKPQYTSGGPMVLEPDSVVIYGDPKRLQKIEAVFTRQIRLNDVGKNGAHGRVRLDTPSGVRISAKETNYNISARRYVEIKSDFIVSALNVPAGESMAIFPPTVTAKIKCEFPVTSNPVGLVECYIDYNEFARSHSGKCIVHCNNMPSGVIDIDITPAVCECILK